jgi:hypothetical protein
VERVKWMMDIDKCVLLRTVAKTKQKWVKKVSLPYLLK